jgi:hypothetical protein
VRVPVLYSWLPGNSGIKNPLLIVLLFLKNTHTSIKQKIQKWIFRRKLTVATSEREGRLSNPRVRAARAPSMEKIYGNLRKPAKVRRARYAAIYSQPRIQYLI